MLAEAGASRKWLAHPKGGWGISPQSVQVASRRLNSSPRSPQHPQPNRTDRGCGILKVAGASSPQSVQVASRRLNSSPRAAPTSSTEPPARLASKISQSLLGKFAQMPTLAIEEFPMNPAVPEPPTPPEQTGLITQRPASLATLPPGNSPALSEIITRSLESLKPRMCCR
jgi:hypothetical protein